MKPGENVEKRRPHLIVVRERNAVGDAILKLGQLLTARCAYDRIAISHDMRDGDIADLGGFNDHHCAVRNCRLLRGKHIGDGEALDQFGTLNGGKAKHACSHRFVGEVGDGGRALLSCRSRKGHVDARVTHLEVALHPRMRHRIFLLKALAVLKEDGEQLLDLIDCKSHAEFLNAKGVFRPFVERVDAERLIGERMSGTRLEPLDERVGADKAHSYDGIVLAELGDGDGLFVVGILCSNRLVQNGILEFAAVCLLLGLEKGFAIIRVSGQRTHGSARHFSGLRKVDGGLERGSRSGHGWKG